MNEDEVWSSAVNGSIRLDTQYLRRHCTTVVIQEIPTRRYWVNAGVWTSDIERATQFNTCSAALEQAAHSKLSNVQLVLAREIKEYETIPLKSTIGA